MKKKTKNAKFERKRLPDMKIEANGKGPQILKKKNTVGTVLKRKSVAGEFL
jgi:hypothetical protein